MRLEDFDEFKGEIKQLCATLGKRFTDALAEAYWRSLRDVDLEEIQAHVERVLMNATSETKFPKPNQLRKTPRCATEGGTNPDLIRRREAWVAQRLQQGTPVEKWHLLDSYLARVDVEEDPGSVFYAERFLWCQEQAERLLKEHGQQWCVYDSHCMHVASRLLGGDAIHARHNRLWDKP